LRGVFGDTSELVLGPLKCDQWSSSVALGLKMSYYTDKVYSANFLSKSRGLDEMLVQDTSSEERRPPLPESRQSRLEARLKETTARDTSYTRPKREPRETVLYLGPSRGAESQMEVRDTRELRDRSRKEDSLPMISSRSNRLLLEESRRSASHLSHGSQTSYTSKTRDAREQNRERDNRPMSMSRTTTSSGQKVESPSRPNSALGTYSSYNTRRSLAPEVFERRTEEKAAMPPSYSSSRLARRGEERDWLPSSSSSSSRLLVRGDQLSGVEIFSHTGGSNALTNIRRPPPIDQSHYYPAKEEPSQYHTDRTFPSRFLTSNPGIEQMIVRRDSR